MSSGPGPALLRLGGGQLLVRGPAVLDLLRLVDLGVRVTRQRDQIEPPPRVRRLLQVLGEEAAELAAVGHEDVRDDDDLPASALELVTVTEVAHMLGRSTRQARRLMPDFGARKVGGVWSVDRAAVAAYLLAVQEADRG